MLIFDPPETNPYSTFQNLFPSSPTNAPVANNNVRIKEHRFIFDRLFDQDASQRDVFNKTTKPLIDVILDGYNATVFAYGATGCGKTHTITGTNAAPGIIPLTMQELFKRIDQLEDTKKIDLSLSYLEVYNETIKDLLNPTSNSTNSGINSLQIREDERRITISNLTSHRPVNVKQVMDMIIQGNLNRTVSSTAANATSSRSHAVLQINLTIKDKTVDISEEHLFSTLSIIDLAGSERASATQNRGVRLNEGANINKSLLALGNCINALCDPRRRNHVPFRDSKLTRLLKFSLGGNCKTVMIVCVSPSSHHYDETLNTLKYANRAKEIKTKVIRNSTNLDRHVTSYLKMISEQKQEIQELKLREKKIINLTVKDQNSKLLKIQNLINNSINEMNEKFNDYNFNSKTSEKSIEISKLIISYKSKINQETELQQWLESFEKVFNSSSSETLTINLEKIISFKISEFTNKCNKFILGLKSDISKIKSLIDSKLVEFNKSLDFLEIQTVKNIKELNDIENNGNYSFYINFLNISKENLKFKLKEIIMEYILKNEENDNFTQFMGYLFIKTIESIIEFKSKLTNENLYKNNDENNNEVSFILKSLMDELNRGLESSLKLTFSVIPSPISFPLSSNNYDYYSLPISTQNLSGAELFSLVGSINSDTLSDTPSDTSVDTYLGDNKDDNEQPSIPQRLNSEAFKPSILTKRVTNQMESIDQTTNTPVKYNKNIIQNGSDTDDDSEWQTIPEESSTTKVKSNDSITHLRTIGNLTTPIKATKLIKPKSSSKKRIHKSYGLESHLQIPSSLRPRRRVSINFKGLTSRPLKPFTQTAPNPTPKKKTINQPSTLITDRNTGKENIISMIPGKCSLNMRTGLGTTPTKLHSPTINTRHAYSRNNDDINSRRLKTRLPIQEMTIENSIQNSNSRR